MKKSLLLAAALTGFAISSFAFTPVAEAKSQCGKASWYALDGNRTANGEIMNSRAMTAAHRSLPFGTKVRVTNMNNGKSVIVRINDRGPFVGGRVIDVSKGAASKIGMVSSGVARVKVTALNGKRIGSC